MCLQAAPTSRGVIALTVTDLSAEPHLQLRDPQPASTSTSGTPSFDSALSPPLIPISGGLSTKTHTQNLQISSIASVFH